MNTAQIVLAYIRALIWPLAVTGLAFAFRREVRAALARIRKAGLPGGFSLDFEQDIQESKELASRVEKAPPRSDRPRIASLPLTDANSRMIKLSLTPTPSGLDLNYYKQVAEKDPNLALAGLRMELEIMTKNLAKGFGLSLRRNAPMATMLRQLRDSSAITPDQFELAQKIISLTNQAVHGRTVTRREAEEIIDSAQALVTDYLAWLGWGFGGDWRPQDTPG